MQTLWHLLNMRTGEPEGQFGYFEKEKLSASAGVRNADLPARNLVIMPTEPSRFNVYTRQNIMNKNELKDFEINISAGAKHLQTVS